MTTEENPMEVPTPADVSPINQAILIAAECGWQLVQQYPGETVERGPFTQVTPPCYRAEKNVPLGNGDDSLMSEMGETLPQLLERILAYETQRLAKGLVN